MAAVSCSKSLPHLDQHYKSSHLFSIHTPNSDQCQGSQPRPSTPPPSAARSPTRRFCPPQRMQHIDAAKSFNNYPHPLPQTSPAINMYPYHGALLPRHPWKETEQVGISLASSSSSPCVGPEHNCTLSNNSFTSSTRCQHEHLGNLMAGSPFLALGSIRASSVDEEGRRGTKGGCGKKAIQCSTFKSNDPIPGLARVRPSSPPPRAKHINAAGLAPPQTIPKRRLFRWPQNLDTAVRHMATMGCM